MDFEYCSMDLEEHSMVVAYHAAKLQFQTHALLQHVMSCFGFHC